MEINSSNLVIDEKVQSSVVMLAKRGVLYIPTGDECYTEALISVRSLKKFNPDLSVTIYTDEREVDPVFDNFVIIEQPQYSAQDKALHMWRTPYEETLYIDSDTYVTGDLSEYFEVLDYCDFAGTIETARGFWHHGKMQVPRALCEFNAGVLCFKNTPPVMESLKQWNDEFLETAKWLGEYGSSKWILTNDQPSLRKLIWTNRDIRVAILPDEYNALRFFGTRLWGEALLVHGRGDIERIAKEMNENAGSNRVYMQGAGTVSDFGDISIWKGIKQCLRMLILIFFCKLRLYRNPIIHYLRNQK